MSFKIIALEVLDSCETEHSKNLKKNSPYVFYKNYNFKNRGENTCIELVSEDFDLYSKEKKLKISISAIVGKNGSGKSTIVELLIKAINNLFYKYRKRHIDKNFHPVEFAKGIEVNVYFKTNEGVFKLYVCSGISKNKCFYRIYRYSFNEFSKEYQVVEEITSSFNLKEFFYTEVINYSLYAYNSNQEGSWIKQIFHKNDAYQTPIVLNPWREKGIININTENDLVYQRLLANLLKYDSKKELNLCLGDNLSASFLVLELSSSEYYERKSKEDFTVDLTQFNNSYRDEILKSLLQSYYGAIPEIRIGQNLLYLSKLYLLYKLISICHKYEEYKNGKYFDKKTQNFINLNGLVERLKKDNSHITFKLRQTLNYLVYQHITFDSKLEINKVPIQKMAEIIQEVAEEESCNVINCLPPPIFRTDIELTPTKSAEQKIKFSTLSSGEKQRIYCTSSIYYHLINLDSVKNSTDRYKIAYRNINIILEEIELYFHPEYQRVFIKRLLDGIRKLNLKNIDGINLIFVTHSPFILSDIPNVNVMYLKLDADGLSEDIKDEKKSFASNIHHLLGDNFFLESNVYIGELARNKIEEIISFINNKNDKKKEEIEYHYELIDLIDEPILKNKLTEMFCNKYSEFYKLKNQERKEKLVKEYAKQMGIKINIDNGE